MERESGLKKLFVPVENYGEANLVKGIEIYAFRTLVEVVNYLQGILDYQPPVLSVIDRPPSEKDGLDFFDVRGQEVLIEYLVAAVAGGHNILMIGPPGCGKRNNQRRLTLLGTTEISVEDLGLAHEVVVAMI